MYNEMSRFYDNVIRDFIQLLQKQYKNKKTYRKIDIESIERKLKSKIKTPKKYFQKLTENYFKKTHPNQLSDQQQQQQNNQIVKQQNSQNQYEKIREHEYQPIGQKIQSQQNNNNNMNNYNNVRQKINRIKSQEINKSIQQDEQDDLNKFKSTNNIYNKNISKIKHQQQQSEQNQFNQNNQQIQDDNDHLQIQDSQLISQQWNDDEIKKIKSNVGVHVIGHYDVNGKKFNSKREELKVNVKNAFVKIQGHQQELFFKSLQLTTKRISRHQLSF